MEAQSILEILKEKYIGKEVTIFIEDVEENIRFASLYDYGVHDFTEKKEVLNVSKSGNEYYLALIYNEEKYSLPLKK